MHANPRGPVSRRGLRPPRPPRPVQRPSVLLATPAGPRGSTGALRGSPGPRQLLARWRWICRAENRDPRAWSTATGASHRPGIRRLPLRGAHRESPSAGMVLRAGARCGSRYLPSFAFRGCGPYGAGRSVFWTKTAGAEVCGVLGAFAGRNGASR
jgi:hypothetical protein